MDLTGKLETDVELKASAEKFREVFCSRPHHISNVSPDKIQGESSCMMVSGARRVLSSAGAMYMAKIAKEKVEAVDPKNNSITFRVIEGNLLKDHKTFILKIDVTTKGEGSVGHWTLDYEKLNEDVAHPETLLEFCSQVSKELDAHLAITQA